MQNQVDRNHNETLMIKGEIFLLFLVGCIRIEKVAKARLLKTKTEKQSKVLDKERPTQKRIKSPNELTSDLLI